ncbi:gliding motility-associated C-terminal domain-containing protein [uncultured Capnocytophaga sp.]|uniref:gliding motility-associated C-terminal domain-containing protein n=1 Tax=uncultured Capnocytophaga sp. TaxID=159273 RepID=UPI002594A323|nr:gliding motility-associated C-terminal domain-containing protein [uncultured Capnocytophaga sp.]
MNTLLLFFLISTVHSQNIINKLTVNTSIHIAMSKFATPLVVEVKIPKGETSVGLKVSFPEGISYSKIEIPQQEKTSVKIEKTTTSTANQPIFIITAAPESVVKILIHRNFNKQVKANVNYSDVVEAILGGKTVEKQTSEFYQLKFPKLTTAMDPIEVGSKGENRRGLTVKNLGEGYIKEFYLSIQYPDNIKNKALYYKKGLNYHLLTPETAVPKEFAKKGFYLYKINVKLLKKEEDAELSLAQEYEIDNCFSPTPIQYQVYWGSDFSTEGFFQVSEITKKIVSNYTVLNKLSYQKGKITGKITDEVLYKGKATISTKDKTFQTGEKSYLKVQLPKGITPIFSLGGVKKVFQLPEGLVEHTFLLPQGKKKNDSFDYTLKLQTNEKLSFVPTSKMVYYTTEESGNGACEAALLYTSIKKEVTIPIDDLLLHPIQLTVVNDTFTHTTTTHTTVLGNILTNDSYNTQSITTASVTISTTTASANAPYIATSTGEVVLPANTSAGIYTLTYSLCAKVAPYNCSGLATVTVIVSKPLVIARDDTYTVTVGTTTITESIYHNDSIGEQTANTSLVNFQAIGGNKDRNNFYILSVNLAGNILIPQGTPTGTYTLQYRICDMNDIHNCATATITVVITEIPILPVVARDDTYTVTIGTTTITESIYHNDSIGDQMVDASLVNFQAIGGSKDSNNFYILSVNLAGNVLIPQATPIGTYTLEYRICDVHHRSNCDSATVRVSVIPPSAPPPTLVVTPDTFTYTGNTIVGNILDNDTINDNPIELPDDDINIEAEEPTDKEPYIDTATGDVLVPTHTPAGTYTLNYELCIENLTICDATTVEVIVPDVLTPTTPTPPIPPQSQDDNPATSLTPYNGISLNGDNKNDYFHIEGIEKYPENIVRIYNKNGLKVFEVTGYDNKNQSFKGFTQGEVTVKKSLELPIGTYFYFIEYTDENHQKQRKIGWLYLKK